MNVDEIRIVVKAETDQAIAKLSQLDNVNKNNHKTGLDLAKSIAGYTTGYQLAAQAGQKILSTTADLVKTSIQLAAAQERVKMEFSVLTGSMETGNRLFKEMNGLAAQTPLEMEAITAAGKQLLSVGVPVDQITTKLRMLGDVAMGNPEKLDRLTQAFGQLRSKGTASMEQINRFVEAGVPIMAELGKTTGVTGQELFKMVSDGKIGFNDVENALKNLTAEGGLYHDMMKKVAETAEGKFSTAMDNAKMALAEVGKEALPIVTGILDAFNKAMDARAQNKTFENILKGETASLFEMQAALDTVTGKIREGSKATGLSAVADLARWKAGKEALERRIAEEKNWQETLKWSAEFQKKKADEEAAAAAKKAASDKAAAERAEKLKKDTEEYAKGLDKAKLSVQALSDTATQGWDRIDEAVVAVNKDSDEYGDSIEKARESIQSMSDKATDGWDRMDESIISVNDDIRATVSLYPLWIDSSMRVGASVDGMAKSFKSTTEAIGTMHDAWMKVAPAIEMSSTKTTELTDLQKDLNAAYKSGFQSMSEGFGAAIVQGEEGWKAFGKAGLNAVAAVLEALAAAEVAKGIAAGFSLIGAPLAPGHFAGGAALYAAAGAVKAIPMAEGGSGMVTKPTLFLAGEAGPESFAFGGANNKALGGGSTRVYNTVNQYIGGSVIAERQVKSLAMSGMAQAARGY